MATYKVLQDIEAEDKFLGPLTLKQFIFAAVTAICLYVNFIALAKHIPFLLLFFVPPMTVTAFLAWPWSRDQPTEVWLLAKIRFFFKPRRRIWNQSGTSEPVTITVPKRVEHQYTNNLSQTEVKSRLKALADTIDSRGWAIKNANVSVSNSRDYINDGTTDRLIIPDSMSQNPLVADVQAEDDMMDLQANPVAQNFDQMMAASAAAHRQDILNTVQNANHKTAKKSPPEDYWFMNEHDNSELPSLGLTKFPAQTIHPGEEGHQAAVPTKKEKELLDKVQQKDEDNHTAYGNMRTIRPLNGHEEKNANKHNPNSVATAPDPAILHLANNDDLNISTIARQARRQQNNEGEVEIPLR